jgi:hypothetical protein
MKLHQLLASADAALPRDWAGDDFVPSLTQMLQRYVDGVRALDDNCPLCAQVKARVDPIEKCGRWLAGAVQSYVKHRPADVYTDVGRAIEAVFDDAQNLYTAEPGTHEQVPPGILIRVAAVDSDKVSPSRGRMFHAPSAMRQWVGTHRYGLPGYPCVYLGGSLGLCCRECGFIKADGGNGVPDRKRVFASRFEFSRKPMLLDFGLRPSFVAKLAGLWNPQSATSKETAQLCVSYATIWPLVASCSLKRRYDGAAFNAEYVVPNAVMQWVQQNSQIDGIRFFSTRHGPADPSSHALEWINYALPTGELGSVNGMMKGYSAKLRNLLRLTDPIEVDVTRFVKGDLAYAQSVYDELVGRAATRFDP